MNKNIEQNSCGMNNVTSTATSYNMSISGIPWTSLHITKSKSKTKIMLWLSTPEQPQVAFSNAK
jgi:hypothetical protein